MNGKTTSLSKAKDAKKDEFYTAYEDIQVEINHYEEKFKGKTIGIRHELAVGTAVQQKTGRLQ